MSATPIRLSAMGIINALGVGKQQVLNNLLIGNSPGMCREAGWLPKNEIYCGRVGDDLPHIPKNLVTFASRNNRLILAALEQIRFEVDQAVGRYGHHRVAVVIGSSTSGILEGELALQAASINGQVPDHYHYRQQEIGTPAIFLASYLSLKGIAYTISTACSSSAKVFVSARNLLQMNLCDAVIVGGADSLCKLTLNGFSALESMSKRLCNPFSINRDGITIGEGAALFLVERGDEGVKLLGVGESADAYHISAPHPEGIGAAQAMKNALQDAGLHASDIDYLNLHGTATPQNDAMESRAVMKTLGDVVHCSSTKPLTGHMLGAAGANEVGLCWLLVSQPEHNAQVPRQIWDGKSDPALAPIALLQDDKPLPGVHRRLMSNSFAFGGSNCCVIIGSV